MVFVWWGFLVTRVYGLPVYIAWWDERVAPLPVGAQWAVRGNASDWQRLYPDDDLYQYQRRFPYTEEPGNVLFIESSASALAGMGDLDAQRSSSWLQLTAAVAHLAADRLTVQYEALLEPASAALAKYAMGQAAGILFGAWAPVTGSVEGLGVTVFTGIAPAEVDVAREYGQPIAVAYRADNDTRCTWYACNGGPAYCVNCRYAPFLNATYSPVPAWQQYVWTFDRTQRRVTVDVTQRGGADAVGNATFDWASWQMMLQPTLAIGTVHATMRVRNLCIHAPDASPPTTIITSTSTSTSRVSLSSSSITTEEPASSTATTRTTPPVRRHTPVASPSVTHDGLTPAQVAFVTGTLVLVVGGMLTACAVCAARQWQARRRPPDLTAFELHRVGPQPAGNDALLSSSSSEETIYVRGPVPVSVCPQSAAAMQAARAYVHIPVAHLGASKTGYGRASVAYGLTSLSTLDDDDDVGGAT